MLVSPRSLGEVLDGNELQVHKNQFIVLTIQEFQEFRLVSGQPRRSKEQREGRETEAEEEEVRPGLYNPISEAVLRNVQR